MPAHVPQALAAFLEAALPVLRADPRLVGVAAGGSWAGDRLDEHSDLDLVLAVEPVAEGEVMRERTEIAARLGPLLAAFTGEHVGEPRLLICLYGPPLVHVDLKFVSLEELGERVEDPHVLWEREGRMTRALSTGLARWPDPDLQWIEDRFWVWVHYLSVKVARGEIYEVLDGLGFLRSRVLGPLAVAAQGGRPQGVRRLETAAGPYLPQIERTLAGLDRVACLAATRAAIDLYRTLRERLATPELVRRGAAEVEALRFLAEVER